MAQELDFFFDFVRKTTISKSMDSDENVVHPFDRRDIHPKLPQKVRNLFDDGYYHDSTFTAFKYIDCLVNFLSGVKESGVKLMMRVFDENNPVIKLNKLSSTSDMDEQKGYRSLFSGAVMALRNPRGHIVHMADDPDECLDYLSFASLLLRRLEQSGIVIDENINFEDINLEDDLRK